MKKSQIQMGENVVLLFIFFILLIISIVFYFNLSGTQADIKQSQNFIDQAVEIAKRVSYMPEAQCSTDNVIEEDCYDIWKLNALSEVYKNNKVHYFYLFGYSNITIKQVFPIKDESELFKGNIYSNVPEKYIDKPRFEIPVFACDNTEIPMKCFFAVMTVDVYRVK